MPEFPGGLAEGVEVGLPEFDGVFGDAVVSGAAGLVPELIEVNAGYSVVEVGPGRGGGRGRGKAGEDNAGGGLAGGQDDGLNDLVF